MRVISSACRHGNGRSRRSCATRTRGQRLGHGLRPADGAALEAAGSAAARLRRAHIEPGSIGRRRQRQSADNPEAARAAELGLTRASMSATLRDHFLAGPRPLVVTGTHGKTTTSSMCAWILREAGLEPASSSAGCRRTSRRARRSARAGARSSRPRGRQRRPAPFVVEGDEYDAVYWNKQPKFFDYVGVARTTSRS